MHWRGIVLTNFDGERWFTPKQDQTLIPRDTGGEYVFGDLLLPPKGNDFLGASILSAADSYRCATRF